MSALPMHTPNKHLSKEVSPNIAHDFDAAHLQAALNSASQHASAAECTFPIFFTIESPHGCYMTCGGWKCCLYG